MIEKLYSLIIALCGYFYISTVFIYVLVAKCLNSTSFLVICSIGITIQILEERKIKYNKLKNITFFILLYFTDIFISQDVILLIQFTLGWLLIGYLITNNLYMTNYATYTGYYKLMLGAVFVISLFYLCSESLLTLGDELITRIYDSNNRTLFYIVLLISVGLLLNRYLRDINNVHKLKSFYKKQIIDFIIVISTSLLITLTKLPILLLKFFGTIIKGPISLLIFLIYFIIENVLHLGQGCTNELINVVMHINNVGEVPISSRSGYTKPVAKEITAAEFKVILESQNIIIHAVIYTGLVILFATIVFIIFKLIKKNKIKQSKYNNAIKINDRKVSNKDVKNNKKIIKYKRNMNNFDLIRFYYRDLISNARIHNILLNKSDTTSDINIKLHGSFNNTLLDDIRKIYIKARYNSSYKPTKEDATQMKSKIISILKN